MRTLAKVFSVVALSAISSHALGASMIIPQGYSISSSEKGVIIGKPAAPISFSSLCALEAGTSSPNSYNVVIVGDGSPVRSFFATSEVLKPGDSLVNFSLRTTCTDIGGSYDV